MSRLSVFFVLILILSSDFSFGQERSDKDSLKEAKKALYKSWMIDSTDNAFDISGFLKDNFGFLALPTIITEPAIGYGGGLGLVHFYENEDKPAELNADGTRRFPASFTGVGGVGTESKTWGVFAVHRGFLANDKVRFKVETGYANINIRFYSFDFLTNGIYTNVQDVPLWLEAEGRIKKSNFFIGGNYFFNYAKVVFQDQALEDLYSQLSEDSGEYFTSGIGPIVQWDSRDNILSPTKGFFIRSNSILNFTWLGSQQNYYLINTTVQYYQPLFKDKLFLAFNLTMENALGDMPFYSSPYVSLRGVPVYRYQGNQMVSLDSEYRYNFYKRWSLVGFVGAGFAAKSFSDFNSDNLAVGGGGGFRYLVSRYYGIQTGMDFAGSSEGFAFYFTVGTYWN